MVRQSVRKSMRRKTTRNYSKKKTRRNNTRRNYSKKKNIKKKYNKKHKYTRNKGGGPNPVSSDHRIPPKDDKSKEILSDIGGVEEDDLDFVYNLEHKKNYVISRNLKANSPGWSSFTTISHTTISHTPSIGSRFRRSMRLDMSVKYSTCDIKITKIPEHPDLPIVFTTFKLSLLPQKLPKGVVAYIFAKNTTDNSKKKILEVRSSYFKTIKKVIERDNDISKINKDFIRHIKNITGESRILLGDTLRNPNEMKRALELPYLIAWVLWDKYHPSNQQNSQINRFFNKNMKWVKNMNIQEGELIRDICNLTIPTVEMLSKFS